MNEKVPVIKNNNYVVKIIGMGYQGEGIAKIENFTIFIPQALKDEVVEIKIVKINKNYAFGKIENIMEPSLHRVEPMCNIYNRCGGCNLQHMSYCGQLEYKNERVLDCITKIGKIQNVIVHQTIGMDDPYSYRNKVQLPVGISNNGNNNVAIGFYAARSHDIINMNTCHIQDEVADKIIKLTRRWMRRSAVEPYNENDGTGVVRHIMIRKGFKTGQVMIVLVTNGYKLPHKEAFVDLITKNVEGITSIVQNVNTELGNRVLGLENITIWGNDYITDYIDEFKFNISPLSFFQINPVQTEVLYNKVLEYADLKGNETVFDAYCGTGTISLFLSQKAKKVYGVEIIPEAIEDAKKNAAINNVNNTEFIVGQSEKVIPKLINDGIKADVVVVDPPRKGCDKKLLDSIIDMQPEKIVYVSCDPATLARDLNTLSNNGYKTLEVQPVDMFPQTAHIEVVTLLVKE